MLKTLVSLAALAAIAACSPPSPQSDTNASQSPAKMETAATPVTGPIQGTGVVTQIDAAAGTVTFNHEAISAISWPAMTMKFQAENPSILKGIAVGDHVTFELKSASETGIVTGVQKQ